ncbi:MAG TPA: PQQ-binding-like beta-propeller repeat protein, partial [Pyrinomonadaceae bacterium]|nr:PQQ-binding-like beta-propeller repeat protein [Pyrinomonadaceae bacterium]
MNTCSATPVSPPTVSIGNATVSEGDSGNTNATFNVNLSAASTKTVVVSFHTAARDTTKDVDYRDDQGARQSQQHHNDQNRSVKGIQMMRKTGLVAVLLLTAVVAPGRAQAQDMAWPQFRGPESNPVGTHAKLADRWSKTENVEWSQEIPGRGWSSPIVTGGKVYLTTVTTDGKSKPPQTGTEYSNEYVAEMQKQGLAMPEIIKRVTERDIELPHEVNLHYFLYCLDLKSGKVEWSKEFYTGKPPGGRHRKNSFISETPVTDGKFIYLYVANLGLWAFDLKGKQ